MLESRCRMDHETRSIRDRPFYGSATRTQIDERLSSGFDLINNRRHRNIKRLKVETLVMHPGRPWPPRMIIAYLHKRFAVCGLN